MEGTGVLDAATTRDFVDGPLGVINRDMAPLQLFPAYGSGNDADATEKKEEKPRKPPRKPKATEVPGHETPAREEPASPLDKLQNWCARLLKDSGESRRLALKLRGYQCSSESAPYVRYSEILAHDEELFEMRFASGWWTTCRRPAWIWSRCTAIWIRWCAPTRSSTLKSWPRCSSGQTY